jgi:hypothetical protein
MEESKKLKQEERECPAEKRRCSMCGKILADANPNLKCFSCSVPMVLDIDKMGRIFRRPTTFKVIGSTSLCSSRETRGFNRVYFQYHGWGKGL